PKWNIDHTYFKIDELEKIEGLITPKTKIIYAETLTNPGVDVLDLEELGKIAKKNNLILIIDNCFASPYLQQPIKFGADLVIHSGTKLMDGQGRVLAGITVGSADLMDKVYRFSRITGPALSPFNAWVLAKSLD
ncbi:MAG TPA: O-succinylhomoserine sulfhydrylase, partial [Maribacter sp.]|nr:O-succinylhomoserine sulfhydrylase [Maribacter sp.]